jgi:hypothetical protein
MLLEKLDRSENETLPGLTQRLGALQLVESELFAIATMRTSIEVLQTRMAGSFEDLTPLEQQPAFLGIPNDLEKRRENLASLGNDTVDTAPLQAHVEEARQLVADQRAAVDAAREQLREVVSLHTSPGETDTQSQLARLREELRRREELVTSTCRELAIAPELQQVAVERGRVEADRRAIVDQLEGRGALMLQLQQRTIYAEHVLAAAQDRLSHLEERLRDEGVDIGAQPARQAELAELLQRREQLKLALQARRVQINEPQVLAELATTEEHLRILQQREEAAAALSARLGEQLVELLARHTPANRVYYGSETFDKLASDWPLLANVDGAKLDSYEEAHRVASKEARHLRLSADTRAHNHGLEEVELDLETCARSLAEGERYLRRYELAAEMVEQVGRHTLQRILPETQAQMQKLLPRLTAGRYRLVKLGVGDQSNPTSNINIKLWDEEAGRYVAKDHFSRGTRDQCQLALRLALALTLAPKGSGAMLGFIWLDEPLSSFDPERSQALIQILSQGAIAEQFDQVVLVSCSHNSNRDSFRFYVRLENGRMSGSNFPQPSGAEQVWLAEATINREA